MKKNTNKKGFTIVELVIVIAVIAILSAVLIPTFGGVIADANAEAAILEAKNAQTTYLSEVENVTKLGTGKLYVCDIVGSGDSKTVTWFGTNATTNEFDKIDEPTLAKGDIVITLKGVEHSHTGSAGADCSDCGAAIPAN